MNSPIPMPCRDCGRPLYTLEVAATRLGERSGMVTGWRVGLVPGFANAKGRHPSGLPWYVPVTGDSPARLVPVPCIVTCHCGHDARVDPRPGTAEQRAVLS